jgi:hypothetical protein
MASSFSATARKSASVILLICLVSTCFLLLAFSEIAWAEADDYIVVKVDGSVSKVCQLVGDWDIERNEPTQSLTFTRYGVAGTDLGASFEHNGELIFLFGDTVGRNAFPLSGKDDSFAHTTDATVDNGLNLTFYTGKPAKFLPPWVPGTSQGAFEVPMDGVEVNGAAYVFFTINHTQERTMGGSILAKLNGATLNFTYLYTFSTDKFINVHTAVVKNWLLAGLPESTGEGLLIWGSGEYRASDPYLAFMPLESIEDKSALCYFAGLTDDGNPIWSKTESDAQPLFHDPVIGELSVAWNQYLERWIMLYSGVSMRSAPLPWGNWSTKQVLFNPFTDGGYKHFIHLPGHDNITDSGRENEIGGPYGPYIIDKFTKGNEQTSTIYFTLSTWNPYTTVLMQAQLEKSQQQTSEFPNPLSTVLFCFVLVVVALFAPHRETTQRDQPSKNEFEFESGPGGI